MGADLTIVKRDEEKKEQVAIWWQLKQAMDRMVANRPGYLSDSQFQELMKAHKFATDKWLKAFDADRDGFYFRDSYNSWNLASLFDLSYWKATDNPDWIDKDGNFNMVGIKHWHTTIASMSDDMFEDRVRGRCEGNNILDEWENNLQYFTDKRAKLLSFLQKAIDLDSPIEWSV